MLRGPLIVRVTLFTTSAVDALCVIVAPRRTIRPPYVFGVSIVSVPVRSTAKSEGPADAISTVGTTWTSTNVSVKWFDGFQARAV